MGKSGETLAGLRRSVLTWHDILPLKGDFLKVNSLVTMYVLRRLTAEGRRAEYVSDMGAKLDPMKFVALT